MLRAAALAVEPDANVRIELVGVEKGSQTFLFAVQKVKEFVGDVSDGMAEFPLVKKAAITLGGLVTTTAITVAVTNSLTPDPRIPDDQMQVFTETRDLLKESVELQRQQQRFYGIVQDEPAYSRIDVFRSDRSLAYSIPRQEFAARSGLWTGDTDEIKPDAETRMATWDVVLIKPVLIPAPRRWRFAKDGLEFSALMEDGSVLQAIHDRTLPVQVAEGVMMKVEITYREISNGRTWIPISGSHKIKRVLSPLPPRSPGPLFSTDIP
ncbi:hypothetical protein [Azospirillum brasilense]|uniref:hypothetical protein n=1 Tax=Azospirillum brasilense TaxID=192 RepID=UPI0010C03B81|nr:hypothetical protein [Azospirillum brasilense]